MRIASISVSNSATGSTQSSPYPVNFKANNFGIGLGLTMTASKGIAADIEHTFDDPKVALSTWHKHEALTSQSASADGNYAFPVTAIRINVTAATATGGTTTLQIVQND